MELDLEIYSHLVKCGVLEGGINNPAHKIMLDLRKVLLDKDTSILFENGIAFSRYLIYLRRRLEAMKVGLKVNADMKSLLVAGDYGIINDYLLALYNFEMQQTGIQVDSASVLNKSVDNSYLSQIQGGQEGAVDIGEMDTQKRPNETLSCLEFLLNIICKAFNMSPKQGAGLLTNANKYLNIAIIKGLKGEYDPVVSLYQETYAHSKHLTQLIEHEHNFNLSTNTLGLILNAFKPGFLSQNDEVVSWCCRLFAKIAYDFVDAGEIIGVAWDWFIDETQGMLETCVQALKKHQEILDSMIPVFVNFARYNFAELFTHHIRKYTPIMADYFNLMHEIVTPLNESKFSRDEMRNTGVIDFWIEQSISKGDTNVGAIDTTKNDRQAAICFLSTLWSLYPEKFDKPLENYEDTSKSRVYQFMKAAQPTEPQSLGQIALTVLKRNCRDKSISLRITAISQLFRLLDQFSAERNQFAPILYKTLIFALIENHSSEQVRQHIMCNFLFTFERISTIPVGILVDPLVRQIYMSEGITFKFNIFDFEFFTAIARHPRLNIKSAIQVADLMAKSYLNENALDFQTTSAVPLMLVVTRFLDHQATQEFIVKFVSVALVMLSQLEKDISDKNAERRQKIQEFEKQIEELKAKRIPKKKWPPELSVEEKVKPPEETTEEVEQRAKQLIRRHRIIDIIKQLVKYRNQDLNDEIKIALLGALKKHIETHGEESKGVVHILDWWWGNPQKLLQEFIKLQKEEESKKELRQSMGEEYPITEYDRPYQSQFDTKSEDSYSRMKNKFFSQMNAQSQVSPDKKQLPPKTKGSIMLKDVVKENKSTLQLKQPYQNYNDKQKPATQAQKPPKNEFLAILENAQKDETKKPPQKKAKEPVRHNFSEFQEVVKSQKDPFSKFQDNTDEFVLDSLGKKSNVAQSHKNLPPYPSGFHKDRQQSMPQLPPIPFPKSQQTKKNMKTQAFNDNSQSPRLEERKPLKAVKSHKTQLNTGKISDDVSVDDDYYKYLRFQQQQMSVKHAKSEHKDKEFLQSLPYDNYLSNKNVKVAALGKRPKDRRVMLEIEKINQKKQEREYKKYLDEQIKQFRDQRQKQKLKQQLERRKLELGIAPVFKKATELAEAKSRASRTRQSRKRWRSEHGTTQDHSDYDDEVADDPRFQKKMDVVILNEGERIPSDREKLRKFIPQMQLLDINREEEERDRIQINLWLGKYQKLFKHLFNKYANTLRNNVDQNFDFKDHKSKLINLGEILKFAKDHNLYPDLLTKDEIQSLVRMITLQKKRTEDLTSLDIEGFTTFYLQMAHNIYYCKEGKIKMSVIETLEQLLKHMSKSMLHKGENVQLYEDPEFVVGQDKQKLKYLNNMIRQDPAMELPEGFYKVYEKELFQTYTLPEYLPISEGKRVALETLDSLVSDIFGIHFLEPRAFPMVVPKIKQEQRILQGKHKKNLQEINSLVQRQKTEARQTSPRIQQISDRLKNEMDQLADKYPLENLEQVALTIEGMLDKITGTSKKQAFRRESGLPQKQIINKIQQDQLKKQLEDEKREQEREVRRLQHEKELRQRMAILQQEREGKEYDKKQSEKMVELTEMEKKKIREEKRQKEMEAKKRALEMKKLQDMEELQRQKEDENERRRQENEQKQILQKEFLKQQKEKIKKGLEEKIQDRKNLVEVQKKVEEVVEEKKNKIKGNMVEYLQKTKEERKQKEEREKEEVNRFLDMPETRQIISKYEKGLKQYYKYFATQDRQTIEFNLEVKNDTINQQEFVKFCLQTNIHPALITHEDLLNIFRQLVRERLQVKSNSIMKQNQYLPDETENLHVIDYEYFKKSLIMISSLAQDLLSGQQRQSSIEQRVQSRQQSRSLPKRIGGQSQLDTSQQQFNIDGSSLTRKTREIKEIKDLQQHAPKYGTKIEDIQISKPLRIETLTHKAFENLFRFLDIGEGDTTTKVQDKIHKMRIELAGQKPTKLKKEEIKKLNNY